MSAEEFHDWQIYYGFEPYGSWPIQMLAATICNASGRYPNKLQPKDFAPG